MLEKKELLADRFFEAALYHRLHKHLACQCTPSIAWTKVMKYEVPIQSI